MEIEGGLYIRLHCEGDRVSQVDIQSSRPLAAVNIFRGKPVDDVLQTLPLLYHVCGNAQANAAVTACEQAMGIEANNTVTSARDMLVWMETAREHCWRILIDWAVMLGEEKHGAALAQIQQSIPAMEQALFSKGKGFQPGATIDLKQDKVQSVVHELETILEDEVFAMSATQWLHNSTEQAFNQWLHSHDTIASRMLRRVKEMNHKVDGRQKTVFLPELDEAQLNERLCQANADDFVAEPLWQGEPCETSSLSRQQHHPLVIEMLERNGNGVLTHIVARLVELASIPKILKQSLQNLSVSTDEHNEQTQAQYLGVGLGQVEAARGRLVHRLELDGNIVQRYQILAPTEWNFHPRGIAAKLLKNLPATDVTQLRQQADLVINSIDPCVQYKMVIH